MAMTVAIVAPGSMGAGVGARLAANGVRVLTTLTGRSAASRERARAAGMIEVPEVELVNADFLLSIVPPGAALALAERMAPFLAASARKPLFVDCNAVSPATVRGIAERLSATGTPFADAGIIGPPPRADRAGPRFYASGEEAAHFEALSRHGLEVRVLRAPIGAASALKMSYAGITKGLIAVSTAMLLAAMRADVGEALRAELEESQRDLFASLKRTVPAMFPKAYRWVAEMEEIGAFAADDAAAETIYRGAAALYARLADDLAGDRAEVHRLEAFLGAKRP